MIWESCGKSNFIHLYFGMVYYWLYHIIGDFWFRFVLIFCMQANGSVIWCFGWEEQRHFCGELWNKLSPKTSADQAAPAPKTRIGNRKKLVKDVREKRGAQRQLRCGVTDSPNGPIFFEFFVGVIPGKQGLIFNHQCRCSHLHVSYIEKLNTVRNG